MNISIISVTKKGNEISKYIAEGLAEYTVRRYSFYKNSDNDSETFNDINELTRKLFFQSRVIIFVCACGIAVRAISKYIASKQSDPAVIVIDDNGKYVIPILSGHIGGANVFSKYIAEKIGAEAIVTTATDTKGLFSPDSFAVENGLVIDDIKIAKEIASAVLNGEPIGLDTDYDHVNLPSEISLDKKCRTGLYIGNKNDHSPFKITLKLIPKNIVLGIGCKKGTSCVLIDEAIRDVLSDNGIDIRRVSQIASIDLKANEQGLVEYCRKNKIDFITFSADDLKNVEGDFTGSDFVASITGVDNVCERCAVMCSGGKIIVRKTAINGVTVAVAEKDIMLDFERSII
ncbi:MAG: cobalt-precorrin 5A hydrolase [Ruminococcus sp.]|nr:cobalt-precorrin 5A hydrolase [Ruminococcus sp.]